MTYFAVLGKNKIISIAELQGIGLENLKQVNDFIVTFETDNTDKLNQLGGIIKRGRVVDESDLESELQDTKIIGINNEDLGKQLKKAGLVRRFKLVKLGHTDLEIKKKGKELIKIDNTHYGIVQGFQNIELYEVIDFGKPGRSMQMGMMPAKLAHIMINLGLSFYRSKAEGVSNTLIYDPFVGSGTTGFLANYMGYDFIGSDIDTKYAIQNLDRRKTTKFYNSDKQFEIFQHDITQPLPQIGKKTEISEKKSPTDNNLIKKILKIATEIHIKYGNTLTEKQYGKIIEQKLTKENIKVEREKNLKIDEDGIFIGTKYIDLIIEDQIVIELKNTPFIHKNDLKQTRSYLNLGNYPTGLLINFGESKINIARLEKDYTKESKNSLSDLSAPLSDLLIVTEGWLGPIVTAYSSTYQIKESQSQVLKLYLSFLDRINELVTRTSSLVTVVCTIPYYINNPNTLEDDIQQKAESLGLQMDSISEIYSRPDQKIGRKIVIIHS